jgi:threonine dehydratase
MIGPEEVLRAQARLGERVHRTPLLRSSLLDAWLGHRFVFKAENLQKIGAFKARGGLNTLLSLEERGELPHRVVAHSSGNHAQAAAWACAGLEIPCTVFMPEGASAIKRLATEAYGARVELAGTRQEAEARSAAMEREGAFLLHPYDLDEVVAGQGTACLEALQDGAAPTAVFTPCGGGGLLSGSVLATRAVAPGCAIFGVEPVYANDAARSYRAGEIFRWDTAPRTLADGVQTLSLSERTFHYVRQSDGVLEVEESEIVYWTQWLTHLLKVTLEPTSVLGMAGAFRWLQGRDPGETVLVILSGGNLSAATRERVWSRDVLETPPRPGLEIPPWP